MSSMSWDEKGDTMAVAKGLGRGLDVLLKGISVDKDSMEVTVLNISDIRPNPRQPRLEFDEQALADLALSIKEQGVLQPILVRPSTQGQAHGYELVAGERRLRASALAGMETIPAIVRDVSDELSLAMALVENLQRENLNALEEAKGYEQLIEQFGFSQESLAQKMGRSRSAVSNSLRLLQLPEEIRESLRSDQISAGHARALLSVTDADARRQLWSRLLDSDMSVREVERQAAHWRETGSLPEGEEHLAPAPRRSSSPKAQRDEQLSNLASRLTEHFGLKVKLGGDGSKGKVTIAYSSADELNNLLDKIGVADAS
ncbi:ParB/RepB/Spo0J family partition protein [Fundidesulfovibrio butyratiphilus]